MTHLVICDGTRRSPGPPRRIVACPSCRRELHADCSPPSNSDGPPDARSGRMYREIDALAERAEYAKAAIADLDRERAAREAELASIRAHLAPRKRDRRVPVLGVVGCASAALLTVVIALGIVAQTARVALVSGSTGAVTPLFVGDGAERLTASIE